MKSSGRERQSEFTHEISGSFSGEVNDTFSKGDLNSGRYFSKEGTGPRKGSRWKKKTKERTGIRGKKSGLRWAKGGEYESESALEDA